MDLQELIRGKVDKVSRYGWTTKDEMGRICMLEKEVLAIDSSYQRELLQTKVMEIAGKWSWVACGAVLVGHRQGRYFVIDGQHRVAAALKRSDIRQLPCVVFETVDVQQEARGFINSNKNRKPISAFAAHKALVCAGDEAAIYVQKTLDQLGLTLAQPAQKVGTIRSIGWCNRRAAENKETFFLVMSLVAEISTAANLPLHECLLEGLFVLHKKHDVGLHDKRLVDRIKDRGAANLIDGAKRASAFYGKGNSAGLSWMKGILTELNKGLRHKFVVDGIDV